MSPVPSSRRRDAAKPSDDFEWPPKADEVSIYELGPDPWQALQDASSQAFAAHRREQAQSQSQSQSQPRQERAAERTTRTPEALRKLAGILTASAIVAAAGGWGLYAAMTQPASVQTFHHPAPVAAAATAPPPITIFATYPVEPEASSTAPASREPDESGDAPRVAIDSGASSAATGMTDQAAPDPEQAVQIAPVDAPADADTTPAPAGTAAPPGGR